MGNDSTILIEQSIKQARLTGIRLTDDKHGYPVSDDSPFLIGSE